MLGKCSFIEQKKQAGGRERLSVNARKSAFERAKVRMGRAEMCKIFPQFPPIGPRLAGNCG